MYSASLPNLGLTDSGEQPPGSHARGTKDFEQGFVDGNMHNLGISQRTRVLLSHVGS